MFENLDGTEKFVFERNRIGDVTGIFKNTYRTMKLTKTGLLDNPVFHKNLLIFIIIIICFHLLISLINIILKIIYTIHNPDFSRREFLLSIIHLLNSSLIIAFVIIIFVALGKYISLYYNGNILFWGFLLSIPIFIIMLFIVKMVLLVLDWKALRTSLKVKYTFLSIVELLFFWFAYTYNLIGWNLI